MCDVRYCRGVAGLVYYGRGVCEEHWEKHCEGVLDLKKEFGLGGSKNDRRNKQKQD